MDNIRQIFSMNDTITMYDAYGTGKHYLILRHFVTVTPRQRHMEEDNCESPSAARCRFVEKASGELRMVPELIPIKQENLWGGGRDWGKH